MPWHLRSPSTVGWLCSFAAPAQAAESEAAGVTAIVVAVVAAVASVVVAYLGLRQATAAKSQATAASTELDDFKAKFVQIILEQKTLETIKLQACAATRFAL